MQTMIHTIEVPKVTNNSTTRKLRNSMLSLAVVATISLPLIASAAVAGNSETYQSLLNAEPRQYASKKPETLYIRLQDLSHDVCGSSDLRISGDLSHSREIDNCYQGTLTAAVVRLNNPEVTELHSN